MSQYVALYRKFRPQTFDQVKGQDHVVQTLKNQIINNRIGHAYLFTGTRGTGKTTIAKLFAKAVNCEHPVGGEPCNECESCRAIMNGSFVDVVEVDAASNNGVDDIRRIIEEIRYTPVKGRFKVFIIDEAHMITGPAFNAFLKTLEEPPAYAVFILATTEPHKLPITILSRCQRYDFKRITSDTIVGNLKGITDSEGVAADDKALKYIARMGDGSMRDSISLLDKCIAFNLGEKLTYENVLSTLGVVDTDVFSRIFRSVVNGDAASALIEIDRAVDEGKDLTQFVTDFVWYLRNLLLIGAAKGQELSVLGISEESMIQLSSDAKLADVTTLMRYIRILSELSNQIRLSVAKQVLVEIGIIKLARPQMETDIESLADRIRQLESGAVKVSGQPQNQYSQQPVFFEERGPGIYYESAYEEPYFDIPQQEMNISVQNGWQQPQQFAEPQMQEIHVKTAEVSGAEQAAMRDRGQTGNAVSRWQEILSACENRMLKSALTKCKVGESEGRFMISAVNEINHKIVRDDVAVRTVKELIKAVTGQDYEIVTGLNIPVDGPVTGTGTVNETSKEKAVRPAMGADPFPDSLLKKINFNIGTEE